MRHYATLATRHFSVQKNPAEDLAGGLRTAPDTGNSRRRQKTVVRAVGGLRRNIGQLSSARGSKDSEQPTK